MKKYVHWIELNGYLGSKDEAREINQLLTYIEKYPDTEIEVYAKRSGWDTVFRIKCNQDYDNLDLDVNSFSSELRRKKRKPSNVAKWMTFENWITSKRRIKMTERIWDYLIEYEIATEDELQLVTDVAGYSVKTLEAVIYARTGYNDLEQLMEVM